MAEFLHITHNSFKTKKYPWVESITTGLKRNKCVICGTDEVFLEDLSVLCDQNKGVAWPDMLGCGDYPLFIISNRVLKDWNQLGINKLPVNKITIELPYPKKLAKSIPPNYFYINGKYLMGAEIDFEGSGYVNVSICQGCGNRTNDFDATEDNLETGEWDLVIKKSTWDGKDLFTTNLSPCVFFCTNKIFECAKENKHTNFDFSPAEDFGNR